MVCQLSLDLEEGMYDLVRITNQEGEYIAHYYVNHYIGGRFTIGLYDLEQVQDLDYSLRNNHGKILEVIDYAHKLHGRKSPIFPGEQYRFDYRSR